MSVTAAACNAVFDAVRACLPVAATQVRISGNVVNAIIVTGSERKDDGTYGDDAGISTFVRIKRQDMPAGVNIVDAGRIEVMDSATNAFVVRRVNGINETGGIIRFQIADEF